MSSLALYSYVCAAGLAAVAAPAATPVLSGIPLHFERNIGQAHPSALFTARGAGYALNLTRSGATLALMHQGATERVEMEFAGAGASTTATLESPLGARSHYFIGNDPKRWLRDIPLFGRARYRDLYPGVDLVWYGSGSHFEYDLLLKPGADLGKIRLRFKGAEVVTGSGGELLLKLNGGELRQLPPIVRQSGKSLRARYVLLSANEVGFEVPGYDRRLPLTIDPVIVYSTFIGGSGTTRATAITVDDAGFAYVAGHTTLPDFSGTTGTGSLFAVKLNQAGTGVSYITYFGGYSDQVTGVAVAPSGTLYISGMAYSLSLGSFGSSLKPVKTAWDQDGFVIALGPSGALQGGTFLGGAASDSVNAIAVDAAGTPYVAGYSWSTDFVGSAGACAVGQHPFVAKLTADLRGFSYFQCFSGNGSDYATAIAVDAAGNAYVTGRTTSTNLAVTPGAIQSSLKGSEDAFAAKLAANGYVVYLTYLGGTSEEGATAIAIDSAGSAYVAGYTQSSDFPVTVGAFSTLRSMYARDCFVAKLNNTGTALSYATYLGGSWDEMPVGIKVDGSGVALVTGVTYSLDFPVTPGAFMSSQQTQYYQNDIFIAALSADGSALNWSGTLGSTQDDSAIAMARDRDGAIYIAGRTSSRNYPTTPGAYLATSPAPANTETGFVTKVNIAAAAVCTASLSGSTGTASGHGETGSLLVTVPEGCPWEAVSDSWITLSQPARGTAPGTVSYTVGVNDDLFSSRRSKITVGAAVFQLTQSAGSCGDPVLSPASLAFSASGGLRNVSVALPSSCLKAVRSSDTWLQVTSGADSFGSGTLSIYAAENLFAARSATLWIAGKTVTVTQPAGPCTASITGPVSMFPAFGGQGVFQVRTSSASCAWSVYGVPAWAQIGMQAASGQGNATIPFLVAANPTGIARSASVNLAGQAITIRQNAGPVYTPYGFTSTRFSQSSGNARGLAWRDGTIYIAADYRIYAATEQGLNTIVVGGGSSSSGPATSVALTSPSAVAFASDGTMYIADYSNVRVVTPGGESRIFAGGGATVPADGVGALQASFSAIVGVAVNASGDVFLSDQYRYRVYKISAGVVTVVAGTGLNSSSGDGGPAVSASLSAPLGLAFDGSGNLYIADAYAGRVRRVALDGTISTFAGGGTGSGENVPATSVNLVNPAYLAIDTAGNLYISNAGNTLRRVTPAGLISTIAGAGSPLPSDSIRGVAVDEAGNVYFADVYAYAVRKLSPAYSYCSWMNSAGAPSAPSPANGSTGMVVNPLLTWAGTAGATSYDVYFGTTNPPPLAGNAACTSYPAGALSNTTTYYWKVAPKGVAVGSSPAWSFTTQGSDYALTVSAAPVVGGTVTATPASPDGTYPAGTTVCFTATPAAGFRFVGWSGDALDGSQCIFMGGPRAVSAVFSYQVDTSALQFVPVTPCRVVDTRGAAGPLGGPLLPEGGSREFSIVGACGIPASAKAYSFNVTAVPQGPLGYLTVWPGGQPRPLVATLNARDGRVKSNAAIVPAGYAGNISVYATNATHLIMDINGYFVPAGTPGALAFYPVSPCRAADTRQADGLGGGPFLVGGGVRTFDLPSSTCGIPASAQAYSVNFAAVPKSARLRYLTAWATGHVQPDTSTLNAPTGVTTANAAIVPAGNRGGVNVYATEDAHLIVDVNGYFAPPGPGGLSLYNISPCRAADTRLPDGTPAFSEMRTIDVAASGCGAAPSARAYVFNSTVVPPGPLVYMTLWPQGLAQPDVSTLNARDGAVTNNMAIVPVSTGAVNVFGSNPTHVILDMFGYFAP